MTGNLLKAKTKASFSPQLVFARCPCGWKNNKKKPKQNKQGTLSCISETAALIYLQLWLGLYFMAWPLLKVLNGMESRQAIWFTEVKVSHHITGGMGSNPTLKNSLTLPLMKPPLLLLRTLPALNCSGWHFPHQVFASGWLFIFEASTEKGQWFLRTS